MIHTYALLALFASVTNTESLPTGLLTAICYIESTHKVDVIHRHDGRGHSLGVCQIKLDTARMVGFKGTEQELMKPRVNVLYAGKYLKKQLNRYNNAIKAIAAYNTGTVKLNTQGDFVNKEYVKKVMAEWYRFSK